MYLSRLFAHPWILIVVFSAYMNSILRLSINSNMSLFRVLIPIIIIHMISKMKLDMIRFCFFGTFVFYYSLITSFLISDYENFDLVFTLHFILVPFCYYLVNHIINCGGLNYVYNLFKFLYKLMIVLSLIQFFFGGVYPNVQDRLPQVNIFFWNENELTAVYAVFIPLFFLLEKKTIFNIIWLILGLFFIYVSDARLLMIGVVLFFSTYLVNYFSLFKYKLLFVITFVAFVTSFVFFSNQITLFDNLTVYDVFMDPIIRIFELRAYDSVGSISDRINAYIWGFIELRKSYFLGIGPGNSIELMKGKADVAHEKWAAQSMHNILLQTVVELGILGFSMLLIFLNKMKNTIRKCNGFDKPIVISYYLSVLIFSTILSGAFSNYAFIFVIVLSFSFFERAKKEDDLYMLK